jgi:hypothetical protein
MTRPQHQDPDLRVTIAHGRVGLDAWVEGTIGSWVVAYRVVVPADMNPRIAELRIFPKEPPVTGRRPKGTWSGAVEHVPRSGLRTQVLRRVRLSLAGKALATTYGSVVTLFDNSGLGALSSSKAPARPKRARRGRKKHADDFLARVAADYVDAVTRGSVTPVMDIANQRAAPTGRVRAWISQARKRGFLAGRGRGRTVGLLTPKAMSALAASTLAVGVVKRGRHSKKGE